MSLYLVIVEFISDDYSIIGCDLTNLDRLQEVIRKAKFSPEDFTLLFSEVVLTYVDKKRYNVFAKV